MRVIMQNYECFCQVFQNDKFSSHRYFVLQEADEVLKVTLDIGWVLRGLDPAAAERTVDELFTTRVHGGVYVAPYAIDPALRVAAAIGVLKDPRRLGALLRR